ncbi:serine hydrolase [Rufibacter psychrotolerans]|uniref:serine hydrolase n=1 Tax=Rufibacter psychrotolerans TaxID=2812556 RepID=UPI00196853DE|nr:serine hydrolase [Rufibacter sp. SYSU D00308]
MNYLMRLLPLVFLMMTVTTQAQNQPKDVLRQKTQQQLQAIIDASPAVTGLVAVDLTSGEAFSFNAQAVFPQASAIKVPILLEVYRQAHNGKFRLTDLRPIAPGQVVGGTGIIKDLPDTTAFSIRNLAVLMIALSDNTATNALIDLVGMKHINASLQAMGLKQTRVQRKMIQAAASGRGEENISTPAEAARLLQLLYKGEFLSKETSAEIVAILQKTNRETSRLAPGLPAHVPLAFKPGILNGVSTEWALVLLPERPYAVAVMENYKVPGQAERVVEDLSKVLYQYFWRLGNATRYGTYVDPKLIK